MLWCRAHAPWGYFYHPWFVVNRKGVISRWEFRHFRNKVRPQWGHVHSDSQPPFEGIGVFFFFNIPRRRTGLLGILEGDENSAAQRAVEFIEKSGDTYPIRHKYFPTWPNSNTYAQWVLDHFPEFGIKLPWNFIGKGYKMNKQDK